MYTIKLLSNEEFDKLPYKHVKTSLGLADPKAGKAFVRATGVKDWDMATISHEVDELVAKVSPHEEDGIRYKGGGGGIQTQVIEDPYKMKVTSPLSEFLSRQVGKGLPSYTQSTGKSLYEPLDPKAYNTYQDFLSLSPSEWYTKGVQEPTMKAMREEIPMISENWAGSLRGSGHFADVEDYMQDTATTLAEGRYKAELEIPQAQFGMAQSYSESVTKQKMLEYADWFQSLPENNPILDKALSFIQGPNGRDIISYLDPGKKGRGSSIGSIMGMVVGAILAAPTGGMSLGMGAMLGGMAGGAGGSLFD